MEINVQDVFNKVIDGGYYPDHIYMCVALRSAHSSMKITVDEYVRAEEEISAYLEGKKTLYRRITGKEEFLGAIHLAWAEEEGVEIYRNWENRPMP